MAYNKNEKKEELLKLAENSRGERIIVNVVTDLDNGTSKFDIRDWYKDNNGELKPGKRGIRLKREDTVEIVAAIIKNLSNDERFDLEGACERLGVSIELANLEE